MTPMAKIIAARHNDAIMTIAFIFALPVAFLVGLSIAKLFA